MAGYYNNSNCCPYETQFSSVDITPTAIQQGRKQPSSDLMNDAERLTRGMYKGIYSCGSMMKGSQDTSVNARDLGRSFDDFSTDFGTFASSATKFLTSITYPDFKLVTNPKPTFGEVGAWNSMNEDFCKQMDSISELGRATNSNRQHFQNMCQQPQTTTCNHRHFPRRIQPRCQGQQQQSSCWPNRQNFQYPQVAGYNYRRPIVQQPMHMPMYYPHC